MYLPFPAGNQYARKTPWEGVFLLFPLRGYYRPRVSRFCVAHPCGLGIQHGSGVFFSNLKPIATSAHRGRICYALDFHFSLDRLFIYPTPLLIGWLGLAVGSRFPAAAAL